MIVGAGKGNRETPGTAAPGRLGLRERKVGLPEQRGKIVIARRGQCVAKAGPKIDAAPIVEERRIDGIDDRFGVDGRKRVRPASPDQDGKLVTADARHDSITAEGSLQAPCNFDQHEIARLMPAAIVDGIQVVDVDKKQGGKGLVVAPGS